MFRKYVAICLVFILLFSGCAMLPPTKKLNRMDEEDRNLMKDEARRSRLMFQGIALGTGALLGLANASANSADDNLKISSTLGLCSLGITSLSTLGSYEAGSAGQIATLAVTLAAAIATFVYINYSIQESLDKTEGDPQQGLSYLLIFMFPVGVLAGAGVGGLVGSIVDLLSN